MLGFWLSKKAAPQVITLGRDFSPVPRGRTRSDGPFSAEAFRDDVLIPALLQGPVVVQLADTLGLAASFIDEVFAGLACRMGWAPDVLAANLQVTSPVETYRRRAVSALLHRDEGGRS